MNISDRKLIEMGRELDERFKVCVISRNYKLINQTLGMIYIMKELVGIKAEEEFEILCGILREEEK